MRPLMYCTFAWLTLWSLGGTFVDRSWAQEEPPAAVPSQPAVQQPVPQPALPTEARPPAVPAAQASAPVAAPRASVTNEKYYVIFFASQSEPRRARFSHTFCTFVKAGGVNPDNPAAEPTFEAHTISWLPVNGHVRVLKLRPERGRNFSLNESLQLARATGQNVVSYGPYETTAEVYNNLVRQKNRLDAGAYLYKAIDTRRAGAINCIHAVTMADPRWGGFGVPDRAFGIPSARILAENISRGNEVLAQNQDWVLEKLAIRTGAGIRYMSYDPDRGQHIARVPSDPNAPVLTRNPDERIAR